MTAKRQLNLEKSTNVRFPRLVSLIMRLGAVIAPNLASRLFAKQFLTPWRAATPGRERVWTVGAKRRTVRCGDYDLAVSYAGLGGPQVLLVHGWSGRGSQLGAFIEPLLDAGYEVNWFDLPAHGRSSGKQAGFVDAVDAVENVIRWLGGAHTVIAHSMGAAATTLAAARGADIGRMVYLASPDDVGSFLTTVGDLIGLPQSVITGAQSHIEQTYDVRFEDLIPTRHAAELTQPLLALHDRDDREVTVEEVERLTHAWPDAELRLTQGLGHRRILRDPDVIRQVVDFVRNQPNSHRAAA
ncbi:MAG: alpha/beta hydrolase [Chloroflexi bacterium]|nr:alpha/beta hydrolase [Chloroflexota bacterium]